MLRMTKMELTVFRGYLKQLVLTATVTMLFITLGVGSLSALPAVAFMLVIYSMSTAGSAYDEQNGWESFRMTMPLSRRDVVFGRYAFNLCVALVAAAGAAVLVVVLLLLGRVLPLTGMAADILSWNSDQLTSCLGALAACMAMGLSVGAVTMPAYFKFGQTKTTQWLAFIMMLLAVAPFLVIGFMGGAIGEQVIQLLSNEAMAGNLTMLGIAVPCVALAAYVASAFVSVRLYEARDL